MPSRVIGKGVIFPMCQGGPRLSVKFKFSFNLILSADNEERGWLVNLTLAGRKPISVWKDREL